jgi:hypothetical protein
MMMGAVILIQAAVSTAVVSSDEIRFFPGSYFERRARADLQRTAMDRWPGPSGLIRLWDSGELGEEDRVALLLGAAAHHDPRLLRLYRAAVTSDSQRLRQAGAYGYHDLLGDRRPNVSRGVDDAASERLSAEIRAVYWTLRRQSLVELWLQALLANEELGLPGYEGVVPERAATDCLSAIDRVMASEDLQLLITAYQISQTRQHRIGLMRLIEGMTLSRFITKPQGDRAVWGQEVYDRALGELDASIERWTSRRCRIGFRRVVSANLERLGALGVDPLHPDACYVWGQILLLEEPAWWAIAARQLYSCGGRWSSLSVLQADSAGNRARRDALIKWHRLDSRGSRRR